MRSTTPVPDQSTSGPLRQRGLLKSLNSFLFIHRVLNRVRWWIFTRIWGMDIAPTTVVSLSAKLDRTYPRGVHIGDECHIAFGATILTHDMCRAIHTDTFIGDRCFIGARAIILPGITVGSGSIVGAGAVVTKDVPSGSIVVGNPARVVRSGIRVGRFGVLQENPEAADLDVPAEPSRRDSLVRQLT